MNEESTAFDKSQAPVQPEIDISIESDENSKFNDFAAEILLKLFAARESKRPKSKREVRITFICALNKTIIAGQRAGKSRVAKKKKKKKRQQGYCGDNPTLKEALEAPDKDKWVEAILAEIAQLEGMKTWQKVSIFPVGVSLFRRTLFSSVNVTQTVV
jgi:hypothetical protein